MSCCESPRPGSNRRLPPCKRGALPTELRGIVGAPIAQAALGRVARPKRCATFGFSIAVAGLEPASPGHEPGEEAAPLHRVTVCQSRWPGSNRQPRPYEGHAPPLSYIVARDCLFFLASMGFSNACVHRWPNGFGLGVSTSTGRVFRFGDGGSGCGSGCRLRRAWDGPGTRRNCLVNPDRRRPDP